MACTSTRRAPVLSVDEKSRMRDRVQPLSARLAARRGRNPVRAAGDHRRASARAVAGSGAQPQCALCGFSPPDCQDKPKVDDDGKPVVSGTPQTGSCNFSRLSLLESKDPRVDGMVRQLREQGRVAGLRRAPRLRRQGHGQSRGRPAARPARPPAPTGESARRPASTGRPAIFGEGSIRIMCGRSVTN